MSKVAFEVPENVAKRLNSLSIFLGEPVEKFLVERIEQFLADAESKFRDVIRETINENSTVVLLSQKFTDKIEVIKIVRKATNIGLKEAKDIVDNADINYSGGSDVPLPLTSDLSDVTDDRRNYVTKEFDRLGIKYTHSDGLRAIARTRLQYQLFNLSFYLDDEVSLDKS